MVIGFLWVLQSIAGPANLVDTMLVCETNVKQGYITAVTETVEKINKRINAKEVTYQGMTITKPFTVSPPTITENNISDSSLIVCVTLNKIH